MNVDIVKLNHWLNARKISRLLISGFSKKLANKIRKSKDFYASENEIHYLTKKLNILKEDIKIQDKIPKYMHWTYKKIQSTKRKIFRDKIHFYNYYTLPSPKGFISPVILDILCPKHKLPKLNNGHLEQAITVALGEGNLFGRWGKNINKNTFQEIKVNREKTNNWIVGDSYVEPAYCPHSYSLSTDKSGKILSYTAKSQLQKFVDGINHWPEESFTNFKDSYKNLKTLGFTSFYLSARGIDLNYLLKKLKMNKSTFLSLIKRDNGNKNKLLRKINKLVGINLSNFEFTEKNEDKVGKVYCSFNKSIKSIRKFKSYKVADMAFSNRYPDLRGIFIKVTNKKNRKRDLNLFSSCHYLVTDGKMEMFISKKRFRISKGDAIWVCPNQVHGFNGNGSLIRISNGEAVDYLDMIELSKLYNPNHTLKRLYKDKFNWGYDN